MPISAVFIMMVLPRRCGVEYDSFAPSRSRAIPFYPTIMFQSTIILSQIILARDTCYISNLTFDTTAMSKLSK
uniref:Uncharacterized protein n=1 Tax=Leersia perrieri TaxID=77586 RepID=A0A0D9XYL1_9ORYZ